MSPSAKKAIRAQLRELRTDLNRWTLKAPGLHIDQALVCSTTQGRLRRGEPVLCSEGRRGICEGCVSTQYRHDHAQPIRAAIRELTAQLDGMPVPAGLGRTEQLPLFA